MKKSIASVLFCLFGLVLILCGSVSADTQSSQTGKEAYSTPVDVGNYYDRTINTIQRSDYVWNVLDWDMSNRKNIMMYGNNGGANQKWEFIYNPEDKTYYIVSGPIPTHNHDWYQSYGYLSVNSAGKVCTFELDNKWKIEKVGTHKNGNIVIIRSAKTGKVLDNPGLYNGVSLHTNDYTGAVSQKFVIHVEKIRV